MRNKITVEVDDKGVVSYDIDVKNSMTMLIALVDAMNHNAKLGDIIDGASEARTAIHSSQKKAIDDDLDKDQIDMFNNSVKNNNNNNNN